MEGLEHHTGELKVKRHCIMYITWTVKWGSRHLHGSLDLSDGFRCLFLA